VHCEPDDGIRENAKRPPKIPEQVETSETKVALQTTQLENHLVLC